MQQGVQTGTEGAYDVAELLRIMVSRSADPPPPSEIETTIDLVRRARGGDRTALDRLFKRCYPPLKRWTTGRLPRWARGMVNTDDLVQNAMLRTFRRLDAFDARGSGALGAYLRRAAQNGLRDELRRVARKPRGTSIPEDAESPEASPLAEAIGQEALERYEKALERLDDIQRAAVVLRVEFGFDYKQIAAELGKSSPDAARMTVSRAIVRLAREMERGDEPA